MSEWTNWEILGAFGFILFCFAVLAGLVVGAALALNHLAYWWEDRHEQPVDRLDSYCRNVSPIRPRTPSLDSVRSRRGDAA